MPDVSRETDRPVASVLAHWFGPAAARATAYAEVLATDGVERGLLGPRESGRLWSRHILNCVVVHPLIRRGATLGDIGSGAGLPGIVLALARPDLTVTLIEPLLRRSVFLTEVVARIGLTNVQVVRSRAEDVAGRLSFDVVTARAVAPMGRLAGWALPLCRPGGELIAWKGSTALDEVAAARQALSRLKVQRIEVESCGLGVVDPVATVVRIQSSGPLVT